MLAWIWPSSTAQKRIRKTHANSKILFLVSCIPIVTAYRQLLIKNITSTTMMLRFFLTTCLAIAALHETTAFAPVAAKKSVDTRLMMDRRSFVNAISAAAILSTASAPAFALSSNPADNEIVKEQRTVTAKLDVNNAPVADYMKYRGLYPTIGGKIANNGPYKSVNDVYKVLSKAEQRKLKEFASELTATPATGLDPMRGRDPYRRSFNDFKEVKVDVSI